ncbi:mechanosensitive ion channel family protein [Segnochrobactraceae bacterium EtOH-i3]
MDGTDETHFYDVFTEASDMVIETTRGLFGWAPYWVAGIAIMLVFGGIGFLIHGTVLRVLGSLFKPGNKFAERLIERTTGPSRLGLIIILMAVPLQSAGFSDRTTNALSHLFLITIIGLVGWAMMTATDTAAGLYLRRFKMDVEDNLLARKHITQVRVLKRASDFVIILFTVAVAAMTFPTIQEYGVSLLASAGMAGIVAGFAARPVLANLIAGIQIAMTQPIRLEDAVVVEGEWGWIEEITGTYVVIRIWDWRRLIVPLTYFTENSFQNWTRETGAIIGSVFLHVDYRAPVEAIRAKATEIARASHNWDGRVINVQVTDVLPTVMQLRVLCSARTSPVAWDLRCEMREKLIQFLQQERPDALPRQRAELAGGRMPAPGEVPPPGAEPGLEGLNGGPSAAVIATAGV